MIAFFQIYGLLLILFFLIITLFAVYQQKSIRPVTVLVGGLDRPALR